MFFPTRWLFGSFALWLSHRSLKLDRRPLRKNVLKIVQVQQTATVSRFGPFNKKVSTQRKPREEAMALGVVAEKPEKKSENLK